MREKNTPVTPSDAHWDAAEALRPLLGGEKEWEVSRDRHHQRCLRDREEDAPHASSSGSSGTMRTPFSFKLRT
ncbi:MAG: hypothetical protein E7211_19175 [Clostridium lundense]|nr:hypothetical protein [Clostridium lundense]